MKILRNILLGLVAIILVLVLISFFLPKSYKVERHTSSNARVEQLFAEINDLQHWKNWSPWQIKDTTMIMSYMGPQAGVGATQEWKSKKSGNGRLTIIESEPNHYITFEMQFDDFKPMQGRIVLDPNPDSTVTITWTAEGELGMNPMMKYFGVMADGMMGPDFEEGLKNIKMICEEKQ